MGKSNDDTLNDSAVNGHDEESSYEEKLKYVSAIASPMASKKSCGRVYKLIKKGMYFEVNVYFTLMTITKLYI